MRLWADLAGWTGAIGVLGAYALVSTRRLDPRHTGYLVTNIVGGALLAVVGIVYGAWPSAVANVVWGGFGLVALAAKLWGNWVRHRRPNPAPSQ
jgi:hypothetical protein